MKKRRAAPPPRRAAAHAPGEATRTPTYDDVLAIARLIESGSRFSEFRLRSGDIEVEVKRGNGVAPAAVTAHAVVPAPDNGTRGQAASGTQPKAQASGSPIAAAPAASRMTVGDLPPGSQVIKSPMVGTFYRAPEPGAPPFVEVGQRVEPDTIVCIIEVMKLMNSVNAGVAGVVTHVFVQNAQPVEFGQPLAAIRPDR